MNIKLIAIGKTDSKALQNLIDDYEKRLRHYVKFDFEIIPDVKKAKNLSETEIKEKEGDLILAKLKPSDELVLMDENGKQFTSIGFSEYLQKKMTFSHQMVRLFTVEQIYRAFTILRNEPYHHQ